MDYYDEAQRVSTAPGKVNTARLAELADHIAQLHDAQAEHFRSRAECWRSGD